MSLKSSLVLVGLLLACTAAVAAPGCSSEPEATDAGTSGRRICSPGAYAFCLCANGTEGTRLCSETGESFGACAKAENVPCPEGPTPVTDSSTPEVDSGPPVPQTPAAEKCDGQNIALNPNIEVTVTGDTTGAADDLKGTGSCAGGAGAPDHVYALSVPATGKLTVTLTPDAKFAPMAYLRTTCADEASQSACAALLAPGQAATLNRNVVKGKPVFLVVDGSAGQNQAGKYTAKIKLTPGFFCGDGEVNDGEACDDSNNVADDGCGADCRNVNGNPDTAKTCPGQPVHVWGGVTTVTGAGTTVGFPNPWTEPGSSCTVGANSNASPDHLYAVTAHKSGMMTVKTTGANYNVLLSARTTCADAATMATAMCANNVGSTAPFDETMTFSVVSGRTYYVGVSGAVGANGTYTVNFQIP